MSENTVNAALQLLGFIKDEVTAHSFLAMASTWAPPSTSRSALAVIVKMVSPDVV